MKANNMDVLRPEQVSEDLESLVKALGTDENPSPVALDLETSGLKLHIDRIFMISWATGTESGVITVQHLERVGYQEATVREVIRPILLNPRQTIIFHNAKFDLGMMVTHGWIEVHEIKARIFDTMLAQYLLGPVDKKEGHNYKLKDLAIRILQVDGDDVIDFEELTAKTRFLELPFAEAKVYSANDTFLTYKLYEVLTNKFSDKPHLLHYFTEIEMPHILNTVEMETRGLGLGENPLESLVHRIGKCIEEEMGPRGNLLNLHNVRSRVQMFHFLKRIEAPLEHAERDRFTFKTKLTTTSFLTMLVKSSGEQVRQGIMNVIKLRGLFKEKQKYEEFLKFLNSRTNRLHAGFNSFLATGRYSTSRPNVLELSSKSRVRDAIKAKPGNVLVVADFSQIDLRVIANLAASAGGGELMKRVNNGYDLHLNTLRIICPLVRPDLFIDKTWKKIPEGDQYTPLKQLRKSLAKPINFGISYGLGAEGLVESLNNLDDLERNILKGKDIMECLNLHFQGSSNQYTKEDGNKFLHAFHSEYPEIKKFQAQAERELLEKGYTVNPFGRECVPPIGRLVMTRTDLQFDVRFKSGDWLRLSGEHVKIDPLGLTFLLKDAWYLDVRPEQESLKISECNPLQLIRTPVFKIINIDLQQVKNILSRPHRNRYSLASELTTLWNRQMRDSHADLLTPGFIGQDEIISFPWVQLPHNVLKVVRVGSKSDSPEIQYRNYDWIRRRTFSYAVQSTSMDFSKIAMTEFRNGVAGLQPRPFLVNCIHDEIVVECTVGQAETVGKILSECMQNNARFRALAKSGNLGVNIVAEVGNPNETYSAAKKEPESYRDFFSKDLKKK